MKRQFIKKHYPKRDNSFNGRLFKEKINVKTPSMENFEFDYFI